MRTINTCSILPEYIEQTLKEIDVINWCGGKWDFSFTKFFIDNITIIDTYLPKKWNQLILDTNKLCGTHDLLFSIPWTKLQFYFANYIFCRDLYKLLNFIWFFKRLSIVITVFILLNRHWKKYFNFIK